MKRAQIGVETRASRSRGLLGAIVGVVLTGSTGCEPIGEYEPLTPPPVYAEMDGELGVLSFRWECLGDTDPTCGTGDFPEAIAVGSRFELVFGREQRAEYDIDLVSASPDRLSGPRLFTAHEAGDVTVVAKDGPSLLDFIELRIETIDRLDMTTIPDEDEVCEWSCEPTGPGNPVGTLRIGEPVRVQVHALHQGDILGGALHYEWSTSDSDVLGLSEEDGRTVLLEPHGGGEVTLTIAAGDHSEEYVFEIGNGPTRTPSDD